MNEEAVLLGGSNGLSSQDNNLGKMLDFFGVLRRSSSVEDLLVDRDHAGERDLRLLASSDRFCELTTHLEANSDHVRLWRRRIHSAFVYAGDDGAALQKLVTRLAGNVSLRWRYSFTGNLMVSDTLPDFCGVMAGVRIPTKGYTVDLSFAWPQHDPNREVISFDHGAVFVRLEYHKVPIFLCACKSIIDLESELPNGTFDIRDHPLQAVPAVLYVKWAFPDACWTAPESNACLIIDDPLLKPTYGFVNFRRLLSLMQRYKFSANIAFIPWNWRRTNADVARLFRENPKHYSLSVHGCAHTHAEFGSDDSEQLYARARQALAHMRQHEAATEITHDRVMVFPQGVFSEAAMRVLKRTELIAAVNNDTISSDDKHRSITVADVWDVAVMAYGNFPLFTRRYPWMGIENFSFDSLLGKPVVIVIHHGFCRNQCAELIEFIESLNAQVRSLVWRNLGDLVRRSCRQRPLSAEVIQVEMYGTELRLENTSECPKHFLIKRRESDPSTIKEIGAGLRQLSWRLSAGYIQFGVELAARESITIRLRFHELEGKDQAEHLSYRARTMLRRYVCELRDNYLHKLSALSSEEL